MPPSRTQILFYCRLPVSEKVSTAAPYGNLSRTYAKRNARSLIATAPVAHLWQLVPTFGLNKGQDKGSQSVRARCDAELPPLIPLSGTPVVQSCRAWNNHVVALIFGASGLPVDRRLWKFKIGGFQRGIFVRGAISIVGVARAPVAIIIFASNPCENLWVYIGFKGTPAQIMQI